MELNLHVLQSPGFLDPYLLYEILKSSERSCERTAVLCYSRKGLKEMNKIIASV